MAKLTIRRGDVVKVDLRGAEGVEKMGERPCVVIQNDVGNQYSPLTIIVPLTDTEQYKRLPVQVVIRAADEVALDKDSVAECGHIRTVDRDRRVLEHWGSLSPDSMTAIDRALRVSMGLE